MITTFSYKGKEIMLNEKDADSADITIEGRVFPATRMEGAIPHWTCGNAFYMPAELPSLAKHLVDYWYVMTDPNTAPPIDTNHPGHSTTGPPDDGGSTHDHSTTKAAKTAAKTKPAAKKTTKPVKKPGSRSGR